MSASDCGWLLKDVYVYVYAPCADRANIGSRWSTCAQPNVVAVCMALSCMWIKTSQVFVIYWARTGDTKDINERAEASWFRIRRTRNLTKNQTALIGRQRSSWSEGRRKGLRQYAHMFACGACGTTLATRCWFIVNAFDLCAPRNVSACTHVKRQGRKKNNLSAPHTFMYVSLFL